MIFQPSRESQNHPRERAKTTACARHQQGQPEQDSQSFPACNCRCRQAPTRVLKYFLQEKESARSRTSRNRKGAPVTAREAHCEPTCKALGRWQPCAEDSLIPANNKSFFSRDSTPLERLLLKRDFSPTLARDSSQEAQEQ